jgi:hypothetical protein
VFLSKINREFTVAYPLVVCSGFIEFIGFVGFIEFLINYYQCKSVSLLGLGSWVLGLRVKGFQSVIICVNLRLKIWLGVEQSDHLCGKKYRNLKQLTLKMCHTE